MKILVVDDDQLSLKTIGHGLKEEGYEVFLAEDATHALNLLEAEKMDLIICDVMMPNVSGLGFINMLKKHSSGQIPVILVSSLDEKSIVENSAGFGAARFLTKPVDPLELNNSVRTLLVN